MKLLVDAGLITREQRGKWAYYRIVPATLAALAGALSPSQGRFGESGFRGEDGARPAQPLTSCDGVSWARIDDTVARAAGPAPISVADAGPHQSPYPRRNSPGWSLDLVGSSGSVTG